VFPEIPPDLPFPKGGDTAPPLKKGGLRGISEFAWQFWSTFLQLNSDPDFDSFIVFSESER
jgi:hypothetical protein